MVLELHEETYNCLVDLISQYMPVVEMCSYDFYPLEYYKKLDEGVERVENDYSKLYSKSVQITPMTPNANNAECSEKILIQLSEDNPHDIQVSSEIYYNSNGYDIGIYFDVYQKIIFSNKELRESKIYFILIFDIVKKGTNIVDCSIHINIYLDNPVYYNSYNYINHDSFRLEYFSKLAYKPRYVADCICHVDMFGSDRCSLKKYLSTISLSEYLSIFKKYLDDNQHKIGHQVYCDMCVLFSNIGYEYPKNFDELSDHLFDIKDKISNGDYINMMDILMKIKHYE
tara:strand:+ start:393 stop:1247 length:855 start_codon:yes stop_codon:yes gene_type:complete